MSPDIASSVRLNNKMTTQGSSAGAKNEKLQFFVGSLCILSYILDENFVVTVINIYVITFCFFNY